MEAFVVLLLVVYSLGSAILSAWGCMYLAVVRNRHPGTWLLLGLVFGLPALATLYMVPAVPEGFDAAKRAAKQQVGGGPFKSGGFS